MSPADLRFIYGYLFVARAEKYAAMADAEAEGDQHMLMVLEDSVAQLDRLMHQVDMEAKVTSSRLWIVWKSVLLLAIVVMAAFMWKGVA